MNCRLEKAQKPPSSSTSTCTSPFPSASRCSTSSPSPALPEPFQVTCASQPCLFLVLSSCLSPPSLPTWDSSVFLSLGFPARSSYSEYLGDSFGTLSRIASSQLYVLSVPSLGRKFGWNVAEWYSPCFVCVSSWFNSQHYKNKQNSKQAT